MKYRLEKKMESTIPRMEGWRIDGINKIKSWNIDWVDTPTVARGEEWLGSGPQSAGGIDEILLSGTWCCRVQAGQGFGPQVVL